MSNFFNINRIEPFNFKDNEFVDFIKEVNFLENETDFFDFAFKFQQFMMIFECANLEIKTKFEVLDKELSVTKNRNPIEVIKTRTKTPRSILKKLRKQENEFSLESIRANLNDVAGVRVVCSFIDDIYDVADMLVMQDDINVLFIKDYIKNPKVNGYRSYHIVVEIPVYFSNMKQNVKVEIQIRTIAMDFWASLEHELRYKKSNITNIDQLSYELAECASVINFTDIRMLELKKKIEKHQ